MSAMDALAQWDQAIGAAPNKATATAPRLTLEPHDEAKRARPDAMYRFFEGRKISRETVDGLSVYAWAHTFPGEVEPGMALVFPTRFKGREVSRVYRHRSGEIYDHEHSAEAALFNGDAIEAPDLIVWASGALAVAALIEAGYPQSVALESGEAEDRRWLAFDTHADLLAAAGKIVLALDDTDTGRATREELARRLGRQRCWLVAWPDQCVGPAATLAHLGTEALQAAIEAAEPYPIEGVHRVTADALLGLRRRKKPPTMGTGVGVLNKILRLPTDGRLIVVLGPPNHGKTPMVRHLAVHTMWKHDRRWAVFSPEMRPWERFAASCAEWKVGKRFWPSGSSDAPDPADNVMTDEEMCEAAEWLRTRLVMLVNDAEKQPPSVDWLLEVAIAAVQRYGITDLWLDPWNEMAHLRPSNLREDEYIGQSLQRLLAFGNRHGCNVWINVHPVTMRLKPGEKMQPPGPYDIAGGAMFFNKADLMLTVFRPGDSPLTRVIIRKAKDHEWGRRGDETEIAFNTVNGRYSTPNA